MNTADDAKNYDCTEELNVHPVIIIIILFFSDCL